MPRYTLIMDYLGGTYISQVNAASPKRAFVKAAQELDQSQISGLGMKTKETLIKHVKTEEPVRLVGVENVWCNIADLRGGIA